MAFLRRGLYIESLLTFRKNPSPTILHDFTKDHTVKAPSLPITKRIWLEGSMTVEAAVLLPIVISVVLFVGSMLEAIRAHGKLQMDLWNIGARLCMYGYGKEELLETFGEEVPLEFVTEGEGDIVKITLTSQNRVGGGVMPLLSFCTQNRFYGHTWTGYDISNQTSESPVVYVTENGTVYHFYRDCRYINIQPIRVESNQLGDKCNIDGMPYEACLKCGREEASTYYYITEWGDCYHWQLDCPSLKRMVFSVYWEEASFLAPCSECAKESEE